MLNINYLIVNSYYEIFLNYKNTICFEILDTILTEIYGEKHFASYEVRQNRICRTVFKLKEKNFPTVFSVFYIHQLQSKMNLI